MMFTSMPSETLPERIGETCTAEQVRDQRKAHRDVREVLARPAHARPDERGLEHDTVALGDRQRSVEHEQPVTLERVVQQRQEVLRCREVPARDDTRFIDSDARKPGTQFLFGDDPHRLRRGV
jgi:hypothetical protein